MADALVHWVENCGGWVPMHVAMKVPTRFEMARRQLEAVNPDVFMLAEAKSPTTTTGRLT